MPEQKRPCYNCEKRTINCHCTCEDYKEYKKALDERNAAARKAKEQENIMSSYIRDNYKKRRWTK